MHEFSFKIFCLTVPKNFVGEHFGIRKFRVEKNFMHQRGGRGYQGFPSKIFSHSGEKFRRGESFSVSLISGIEKLYASEGYVTIFDFLSNFFVS